jgi:arylsulfatase A-like enzyme
MFTSRHLLFSLILLQHWAAPVHKVSAEENRKANPCIVYILADDLGYGDVKCLNPAGKIATPNLDRLAGNGMIFTDAHSSSSVCTPTRYGILTGRYNWRSRLQSGVLGGYSRRLIEPGRLTVPSLLKSHGYDTACIGKWHLGMDWPLKEGGFANDYPDAWNVDYSKAIRNGPLSVGFDSYFGISASLDMPPFIFIENDRCQGVPTVEKTWIRKGPARKEFEAGNVLPTLTKKAVEYIARHSGAVKEGRPIYLYLALTAPHTPILPVKEWQGKSGLNAYGDFVMQVDESVGKLLSALESGGIANNTLVIFTSDNGCSPAADFPLLASKGHHPSYHFRGHKADIFDGGHRIPFLARWPGRIEAGSRSNQLICLTDLLATCAEVVGKPLPSSAGEDSVSLLPALLGTAKGPLREAVVHHSANGSFAIRQGKWKLELCPGSGGWSAPRPGRDDTSKLPLAQLYDVESDVGEKKNIYDKNLEVVARLTKLLERYVADGRSTPGEKQKNTVAVDIWKAGKDAHRPLKKKRTQPNIVLILADDMGFSDLGCYGSEIRTPNVDRLAASGLRFTQFYNCARCCPTRASLLTGMYPHQVGVGHMVKDLGRPAYRGDLSRRFLTIAEALKSAGYRTGMVGKWHVTPLDKGKNNWPRQRGFDKFYGLIGSVRSYFDPLTLTRESESIRAGKGFYLTDSLTDQAIRYIDDFAKGAAPFFLYVAYTAPHWPLHALKADIARYKDTYRIGWDELRRRRHARQVKLGLVDPRWKLTPRDSEAAAWTDAPDQVWQASRMAAYAAMIERLDGGVGRIIGRLEKSGRANDTLVLFLSDNGGCAEDIPASWRGTMFPKTTRDGRPTRVGNDPAVQPGPDDTFQSYGLAWANASNTPFRRYKHWVHEGGIATPFIARWPAKIYRGGITHEVGHVIDLLPTCLDLAGVRYPDTVLGEKSVPLEGKTLLPVLLGGNRDGHEALYWEHEGNRAVRAGKWKLVAQHDEKWELYDLDADRTEQTDRASKRPDKVKQLADKYRRWAERCGVVPWETLGVKP